MAIIFPQIKGFIGSGKTGIRFPSSDSAGGSNPSPLVRLTLSETARTYNSASLSWDNPDALSSFDVYRNGVLLATQAGTTYTATSLPFGETSYFSVIGTDGEFLTPASNMITHIAVYTPPTLTEVSKTDTTINLSASNPDSLSLIELYQDGVLTASGSVFTFELSALTAATSYEFTARTGDGQGNWSALSDPLVVVTDAAGVEPDKPVISRLAVIGASIMQRAFVGNAPDGSDADKWRTLMLSENIDIDFRSYAIGGNDLTDTLAQAQQLIADIGLEEGVAVICHTGGNETFDWDSSTQEQRDTFSDRLELIYQTINSAGYHLIPTPLTHSYNPTVDYDRKQIGDNLIKPLIQQYAPYWWDADTSQAIFDLYKLLEGVGSDYYIDSVHLSDIGRNLMRQYIIDSLKSRLSLPVYDGEEVITIALAEDYSFIDKSVGNHNIPSADWSLGSFVNNRGEAIAGSMSVTGFPDISTPNYTGFESPSRWSWYESNRNRLSYGRFTSKDIDGQFTITIPSFAGRTGTLKYAGCRSSVARNTTVVVGVNSDNAETQTGKLAVVPFEFNSEGGLIIEANVTQSYAYFSAMSLYFDPVT